LRLVTADTRARVVTEKYPTFGPDDRIYGNGNAIASLKNDFSTPILLYINSAPTFIKYPTVNLMEGI
jgi:hypothetical protein